MMQNRVVTRCGVEQVQKEASIPACNIRIVRIG
jgi:hypothetical protein